MKLHYGIGGQDGPEKIHECGLRILSEIGAAFHCEEAVEVFRRHGARVDGQTVYIEKEMVEEALRTVPGSFDWYGRLGDKITVGDGSTHALPAYGPIYVLVDGNYEKSSHQHLVNFHKLCETSQVVEAANANIIDVSYVPHEQREKYRIGVALQYCTKPMMGLVEGKAAAEMGLSAMRRFYGVQDKPISLGLIDTMGPMRLNTAMCEALMVYAKERQPLIIGPGQSFGITTPQSLAADYTLGNAMILAALVLTQLISPGTPVVYSGKTDSDDLRMTSAAAYGGIEAMLSGATAYQMGKFYGLPVHSGNANTDSKALDYQCGAETFMNLFTAYMNGVDCMLHSTAVLDSYNAVSYEKFLLDEERILGFQRLLRGYTVSDETLMFEKMKKTGPTGQSFERTQKSYHTDYYMPKLVQRDGHNAWIAKECPTAETMAAAAWRERIQQYQAPELDQAQRAILEELIPESYR
ncbi:MAG: trimethylamine methyltransferase family protein [Oscillospiraceae bacterium]|nr:trimethylamine methyltransferase family protein [Oscillospiraceae bacterium]